MGLTSFVFSYACCASLLDVSPEVRKQKQNSKELRNPCLPEARSTLNYREFFSLRDCFSVEKLTGVMARIFRGMNRKCGF